MTIWNYIQFEHWITERKQKAEKYSQRRAPPGASEDLKYLFELTGDPNTQPIASGRNRRGNRTVFSPSSLVNVGGAKCSFLGVRKIIFKQILEGIERERGGVRRSSTLNAYQLPWVNDLPCAVRWQLYNRRTGETGYSPLPAENVSSLSHSSLLILGPFLLPSRRWFSWLGWVWVWAAFGCLSFSWSSCWWHRSCGLHAHW